MADPYNWRFVRLLPPTMRQITLSHLLIEEQRNRNVIAPDLRLPIEVVSRIATGSLDSIHEVERIDRWHDQ